MARSTSRIVDSCAMLALAGCVILAVGMWAFGWRPHLNISAGSDGAAVSVRLH